MQTHQLGSEKLVSVKLTCAGSIKMLCKTAKLNSDKIVVFVIKTRDYKQHQ